jgi:hypothetical protein
MLVIISPPCGAAGGPVYLWGIICRSLLHSPLSKEPAHPGRAGRTHNKELAQAKEIEKAYNELKVTQSQIIQSEKMASLGELTAELHTRFKTR